MLWYKHASWGPTKNHCWGHSAGCGEICGAGGYVVDDAPHGAITGHCKY